MEFRYRELYDYAYIKDLYASLDYLEKIAMEDKWNYEGNHDKKNQRTPILENYVFHTFKRLCEEYRGAQTTQEANSIIYISNEFSCFNTGLYTEQYEQIYGVLTKAKYEDDARPWFFFGFVTESNNILNEIHPLPRRANYFTQISDLVYDHTLDVRSNSEHILNQNLGRFPKEIRESKNLQALFNGAIDIAKKKAAANYKIAVPTFYNGEICLLLPICLIDKKQADVALAIRRMEGYYSARTCLTLDMAYNDARLIARQNSDWLQV